MESLYIIIPAYNEEKNIEKVIEDWYPVVERHNGNGTSRLVVINDGSTDATYELLCSYAEKRELLCPISKENGGHGSAILEGYKYALEQGADYIFQTDSDGQTIPSEFESFWEQRKEYDMLIGQRRKRQDGWYRIAVTKILKFVVRSIFGVQVDDPNVPYRLMNAASLEDAVSVIPEGYNLTNVIIAVACKKKSYSMKSIPITFRPRQGGVNSINMKRIIGIGFGAVKSFYRLNKAFKNENQN